MKKRLLSLLLAAAMLWGMLPAALAEAQHAPYVPGELTKALFRDAYQSGSAIRTDMGMALSINAEQLGITGDELDALNAALDALQNAKISVAAAKLEDGVMLDLSGAYLEGAEAVGLDAQLEITKTGLAFTSAALLPGERVSVTWETLLALCGLDEATAAQVLALRDMSLEEIQAGLASAVTSLASAAQTALTPYLQTCVDFIAAQPFSVEENVAADGIFPAAAQEVVFTVSGEALGQLLIALCDQLEADETLVPVLDALFAQLVTDEEPFTTADLCAVLRQEAETLAEEIGAEYVVVGQDEAGSLLYASATVSTASGYGSACNLVCTAWTPEQVDFRLEIFTTDCGTADSGFSIAAQYAADPADPQIVTLSYTLRFMEYACDMLNMAFDLYTEPFVTEDGMSGYRGVCTCTQTMYDFPLNSIASECEMALTAEGGESTRVSATSSTFYDGELAQTVSEQGSFVVTPGEDGPTAEYVLTGAVPESGLDQYTLRARVYAQPYAPDAALTSLALDTASPEETQALLARIEDNAEAVGSALLEKLPEPLLAYLERAEEEDIEEDFEEDIAEAPQKLYKISM